MSSIPALFYYPTVSKVSDSTFTKISDCRCVVMWGYIICHACWCISFWGSWWTQGLPKDNTSISLGLIIASSICYTNLIWKCPSYYFLQRILSVQYSIPDGVQISTEGHHLISRIFVADPGAVSNYGFCKNIIYILIILGFLFLPTASEISNLDTLLDAIIWVPLRYFSSYVLLITMCQI